MNKGAIAAHTARNSAPILDVLRLEFRDAREILEIGSGSGQHATTVAAELQQLVWQTSDVDENHAQICRWLDCNGVSNVLPPLSVDVRTATLPSASYDGVFSANTAHIMSAAAVARMFELAASVLRAQGVFCLYGPFRQQGEFNAPSNAAFHASLHARDPAMGIRHLEEMDQFAAGGGLLRQKLYAMPANNYLVVWKKAEE